MRPETASDPASPATIDSVAEQAARLDRRLADASPRDIIAEAIRSVPCGRLAVVSSFGTESAVLLKYVADIDRSIAVVFLDTGWLFEETLAYRNTLIDTLHLQDVRTVLPPAADEARADPQRDLWASDPDACCALRKVVPLAAALADFDAWTTGRKRFQGGERARLPVVEADGGRLKFNPLARLTSAEIGLEMAASGLPSHPLAAAGYASLGCMPCTSRTQPGEDPRAGRWRGRGKTECGIHQNLAPRQDSAAYVLK
jgi:phosphoadenosine phosphosulfate reductase